MSRSKFNEFRAKRLQSPAVRDAYEDARARNLILDQLVRRRLDLKIKQVELAQAMDVGQSTVSGFETEGSDPRLSTLQRYARAVKARLFVHVIPETDDGLQPNFYISYSGGRPTRVQHLAVTTRARTWADSKPYVEPPLKQLVS